MEVSYTEVAKGEEMKMTNQIIKNTISTAASNSLASHSGEIIRALNGSPKSLLIFGGMLLTAGVIAYCVDCGCGVDIDLDCAGMHAGVKIHSEGKGEL